MSGSAYQTSNQGGNAWYYFDTIDLFNNRNLILAMPYNDSLFSKMKAVCFSYQTCVHHALLYQECIAYIELMN